MNPRTYLPLVPFVVFIILLQVLFSVTGTQYFLTQLTMAAYYALVVVGLCLLMGYAGQISLGHAGFFAIGGYSSAVLTTHNLIAHADSGIVMFLTRISWMQRRVDLYGNEILAFSPWVGFVAAVLIAVAIAFVIGIPVTRLKGHYLAMATLGFGIIIYAIVLGTKFLGESDGITNVPNFRLFLGLQVNGRMPFRVQNYYIAWFLVAVAVVLSLNLVNSRVGRALRSIHGSEEASNAMGVNTSRYKLYTFVLSAVMAAVGGAFAVHYNGGIGPSEVSVTKSVRYVAIVAVGGMSNLWGVVVMGTVLNFLSLRGYFGSYDDAVFGAILIAVMIFAPQGILRLGDIRKRLRIPWRSKSDNSEMDSLLK